MHLHLIRLTLETESPLSIGSGRVVTRRRKETGSEEPAEHAADAIVRDANGLPTIPGPSYQGVLRRLARKAMGAARAEEIFGKGGDRPEDGQAGTVICGWGHVHDAEDAAANPMPGMARRDDPVLSFLGRDAPLWRDHVALGHRLSVEDRKKFARTAVPRGARFSLELGRYGTEDDTTLIEVAALFRHPDFRLGSSRNRGYGRLRVIRASHVCVAPDAPERLRDLRATAPHVAFERDLMANPRFAAPAGDTTVLTLKLVADGFLRMGGATEETATLTGGTFGARSLTDGATPRWWEDEPPREPRENMLQLLTEPLISYPPPGSNGKAEVLTAREVMQSNDPALLSRLGFPVPGSQLRQPVAHRALFHWNRANGRCVDADAYASADAAARVRMEEALQTYARRSEDLAAFFGTAKGPTVNGTPTPGRAGRLLADDTHITARWAVALDHASIDRFTGGVRDRTGVLYAEEVLYGAELSVCFRISEGPATSPESIGGWSPAVADAFLKAVRDLCTGQLLIGARSLGACTGAGSLSGAHAEAWGRRARDLGVPLADGEGA